MVVCLASHRFFGCSAILLSGVVLRAWNRTFRNARKACAAAAAALAQRKAAIAAATEQARIRGFWSDYSLRIYREQMDEIEASDRARAAGIPLPPAPPPDRSFAARVALREEARAAKAEHDRRKSQRRVSERPVVRFVVAHVVHPVMPQPISPFPSSFTPRIFFCRYIHAAPAENVVPAVAKAEAVLAVDARQAEEPAQPELAGLYNSHPKSEPDHCCRVV